MKLNLTDLSTKDLRKAAFAVGFGLYFGKEMGKLAKTALDSVIIGGFKHAAKNGNEFAQYACEESNIKYEKSEEKEDNKSEVKMGFHL